MAKNTAQFWIDKLNLQKHPFMNGYFKEIFRDEFQVCFNEGQNSRSASTLIYYLHLPQGFLGNK